jgi:hypothetical protein
MALDKKLIATLEKYAQVFKEARVQMTKASRINPYILRLILLGLLTNSCGASKSDPDDATPQTESKISAGIGKADLIGTYSSECIKQARSEGLVMSTTINESHFISIITGYRDTSCQTIYHTQRIVRSYTLGDDLGQNIHAINFSYEIYEITPQDDLVVTQLNANNTWNYSDWSVGVARDVTGRQHLGRTAPQAGSKKFATFRLEGNILTTDVPFELADGLTESGRSYTLVTNMPMAKK